jgi:putative zinc finger/helix-turn-helix YgiT family protein
MKPEEFDYTTEIVHDGRTYQVNVPGLRTPRCQTSECRKILLDTDANRRITQAFRRAANLLEPEEIRRRREALGLTQAALAKRLEVGPATVSRWETGAQIQQRSLDKLLRLFFDLPEVRRTLEPPSQGKFRSLRPTQELRVRAGKFRLTASKVSTVGTDSGEREEVLEVTTE